MSRDDVVQLVVFRVGGHQFAFDILSVQRIVRYAAPAAVPRAPAFLEGVLQIEGAVVPVIDLRKRFELPVPGARAGDDARIMVVDVGGATVGLVVDAASEILRVGADAIHSPPPVVQGLAAAYVQGVVTLPGRTVVLLHAARLLSSTEKIALQPGGAESAHG